MHQQKIRVIIAEDHEMFRHLLTEELERLGIEVIGQAENGEVLIDLLKKEPPDIVLLDLRMPKMDGQTALRLMTEMWSTVRVIVLSNYSTNYYVATMIKNGARAYLIKSSPISEVVAALNAVYNDGYYFNGMISREVMEQLKTEKKLYYYIGDQRFSEREIEVIQELCKDLTNGQIADNLNISPSTVQYHKNTIRRKTGSDTMISLVKYAIRESLIENEG